MKKFLFILSLASFGLVVGYNAHTRQKAITSDLTMENVEAIAACEITKGDNVKFACLGEEGECKISGFGYELTCSGTKEEL